ncbi:MAG: serine hydrolase [Vicinamibacterales bacterium]
MEPFEAYHGRTSQQHQEAFNRLSGSGYRMIALSVYGDPGSQRYNAVWVQRGGGSYLAFHDVRASDYQSRFDQAVATGRAPVLVTATGSGNGAIFAAVFEAGVRGAWVARHNLNRAAFEAADVQATAAGLTLRSMSIYGTPGAELFAGVWHTRRSAGYSHLRTLTPSGDYQAVFDAELTIPYARPALVAVGPGQSVGAVFRNDVVGPWAARHGMTAATYQQEFNRQVAAGRCPISIDAAGSGASARFAAVFAERDVPLDRQWTAVGQRPAELAGVETLVQNFMLRYGVRAAQLSIARDGAVPFDRAYTWSEPGTRQTGNHDRMLLASNSKMFVAAAVQWLYDNGSLASTDAAFPLLGFSRPRDSRCDQITVQQLLDHRAGFANSPSDVTYDMRQVARDLGLSRPPQAIEIARRVYDTRMLATAPGNTYSYSNIGYLVAMAVVEQVSGRAFFDFVRRRLLQPLGLTEVALCPTPGPSGRPADQVIPEDDGLGLTTINPQASTFVANVFGGDGMFKESTVGSCGLASSATALATFIGTHAVWGNGGRMTARRYGSTPGCRSAAVSKTNGVDWAFIINTRVGIDDTAWNALIDAIDVALDGWRRSRVVGRLSSTSAVRIARTRRSG